MRADLRLAYGVFCGVAGPVISSLLSGDARRRAARLLHPELLTYGPVSGLLFRFIRTGRLYADIYLSLVPAMIAGRIVGGAAQTMFYLATARTYSIALWASAYLVKTLPGIVVQLVVVPALVLVLTRARLIPARYPKRRTETDGTDD